MRLNVLVFDTARHVNSVRCLHAGLCRLEQTELHRQSDGTCKWFTSYTDPPLCLLRSKGCINGVFL